MMLPAQTEESSNELNFISFQTIAHRKNENSRVVTPSSSASKFCEINANGTCVDEPVLINSDEDERAPNSKTKRAMKGETALSHEKTFDYQKFNDKRAMSSLQERWNAITMIPAMVYGIYFILAGCWITSEQIEFARSSYEFQDAQSSSLGRWIFSARNLLGGAQDFDTDASDGCISISWLPHLHALPPLPLIAGAMGVVVHAPFSMLYHWTYATKLHPSKRLEHWSRRLDHAFIHFASACMAYATSGNIQYFLINAVYNLDCAYRQFEEKVRPRRNQVRITISILMYILPVLHRGYYGDFAQLMLIFSLSGWFFITYPIGGWSHAMFHVVVAFLPHVIMVSSCKLPISQQQIELAAQCAVRAGQ